MNIWRQILNIFRREVGEVNTSSAYRLNKVPLSVYTDQPAMSIASVFRCVKLLSESVAVLPVQFLKRKGGIFVDARDNHLDYLLNVQPDSAVNAFDFWRQVVQEMLLEGNAYIVPVYSSVDMRLERLVLCGRGTVSHDINTDTYDVCDVTNGVSGHFTEDQIIHIKGLTLRNCKRGVSVLTHARLTMSIASTGDLETQNRFANGGNVRGIVSNDQSVRGFGEYQDEQLERTAETLDTRFQSGERIVGLPGQVDFKQISLSSTDMQFLESRKFTVREICRFFGVHPSFVFDDTSNNYKSVEQADADFLTHTLAPLLRNIEIELRRKLIAPELSAKYKFSFDRRDLHVCDLSGMMDYRIKLLQIGTTINEVRKLDNLPPVEGGDTVFVSANLKSLNEMTTAPESQPDEAASQESDNKQDQPEDGTEE